MSIPAASPSETEAESAQSGANGLRRLLLRAATEDFIAQARHEPEELRRFVELAGHLIDDADETELLGVADALCLHPDAPTEILHRIFARGGAPARKILRRDVRLTAPALQEIARDRGCSDAAAIAGRRDLDAATVALLAARPEREILRRLAGNAALGFSADQWVRLIARGRDDPTLASALLGRDDGPTLDMAPLFLHADTGQRARLLARALEADCAAGGADFSKAFSALFSARFSARARETTPKILRATQPGALALALSRALGADFFRTRRLVADPSGEALILALRALGLDAAEIEKIIAATAPRLHLRENFSAALALAGAAPRRVALRLTAAMLDPPAPERQDQGEKQRRRG